MATSRDGTSTLPVPFAYVRHMLAERWGCKPSAIDAVEDKEDIGITLEIMAIEATYGPKPKS